MRTLLLLLVPAIAFAAGPSENFKRDYAKAQAECRAMKAPASKVSECLEQVRGFANHAARAQGLDEMPVPKAVGCPPSRKAKK